MTQLLLDADIIAFKIASVSQKTFQFDPADEPTVMADDWEEVAPRIDAAINDLKARLFTDNVIVCLSCPTSENFRLDILPTYKGKRDYSKRPVHLDAVKDYMEENYPSYRRPRLEADDILGILSTSGHGKKIVVSEDKDLRTIPGWLFNPAKDTQPQLISTHEADRFHLYQTLVGDTVDCYEGCPGAGPGKANIALGGGLYTPYTHTFKSGPRKGQEEARWVIDTSGHGVGAWGRVVALYARYGLTEADALVQARVARILRSTDFNFTTKTPILWTPASTPRSPMTATA